jgi:hypothetical protein
MVRRSAPARGGNWKCRVLLTFDGLSAQAAPEAITFYPHFY